MGAECERLAIWEKFDARSVTLFYIIWDFAFPELISFFESKYASVHEKVFYAGFDFFLSLLTFIVCWHDIC